MLAVTFFPENSMQPSRASELARCDREIASMRDPARAEEPAVLTALGELDWEHEKRLIEAEEDK